MYEDAAAAAVACVEPHRGIMAIWWVSECCREMAGPPRCSYMYFQGRFYNSWEMINSLSGRVTDEARALVLGASCTKVVPVHPSDECVQPAPRHGWTGRAWDANWWTFERYVVFGKGTLSPPAKQ